MTAASRGYQSVELFTGAGGLALATHMAGFGHAGLFEWNPDACETLRSNAAEKAVRGLTKWRDIVTEGDVSEVAFGRFEGVDLVAGGPPCQPFSLGGKHRGMEDSRDMIPQFIRAVREIQPRAFIMENVRGLARKTFSTYLNYSILQLTYPELIRKSGDSWEQHFARLQKRHTSSPKPKGLTYNVVYNVLNAADYGVPQCRERLFVVGFRSDVDANWAFPKPTHSMNRLMYEQWVTGEYWERVGVKPSGSASRRRKHVIAIANDVKDGVKPWRTIREAVADLPAPFVNKDNDGVVFNHKYQPGARPYPGHTGSPFDYPSKTLKAGDHGVPGGENMIVLGGGKYRYLTIREAARIQTFPDSWHFRGAWSEAMRQLGNAVPVELAKVIAKSVSSTLHASDRK